jgi:localization factor PodJL
VAQYQLAMTRLGEGKTPAAAALFKRAASQGLAMAQYRLAKLYEHGAGVAVDPAAARRLTEQAALSGNSSAMYDLGVYLANGEGSALDEKGAFGWFKQAAEYGVADAQFNVALLYLQGRGVAPDPDEAYFWFSVAARGGDHDAAARAAMIERNMARAEVKALRERAKTFHAKPASAYANGDFGAQPWAPPSTQEASASSAPQS